MLMSEEHHTSEMIEIENGISVFAKNIRCHLTIIKWTGVVILAVLCSIPTLVLTLQSSSDCVTSITDVNATVQPNLNQTACVYVKQFHLQNQLFTTVCNLDGHVFVDVRRFVNGTATIKGVDLTLNQWLILKQHTSSIDEAITEARTYWKKLRTYQ